MILMIDNYDSFTYNLVQYLGELGQELKVFRNDKITLAQVQSLRPRQIVISPGPGGPDDSGISQDIIRNFAGKVPILGVCLGHQVLAHVYGGRVLKAANLMHGKTSLVYHNCKDIFRNLPNPFQATRYHSLIVEKNTLPSCFSITAWTKADEIMGIKHKKLPLFGVQFHPESIMTESGKELLKNFIHIK